jgi:DNA-binding transcriptional LysR family regulator
VVTPAQLRAFSTVVRLGSVKAAAEELGVSEPAVSLHVGQLRRELGDQLYARTASGLAFTPGGLKLARRATEMLGLADRTVREVSQAGQGRRTLSVAACSLFAEHAAPGLIDLFTGRARDLDVELSVHHPRHVPQLLAGRVVDLALGTRPDPLPGGLVHRTFMTYEIVLVAAPDHPLVAAPVDRATLRDQTWLLGPAAADDLGGVPCLVASLGVPEQRQHIFQSHAAALAEAERGLGVAPALSFAVREALAAGRLARVDHPAAHSEGAWSVMALPDHGQVAAAAELVRFVSTPRALQAMLRGTGVGIRRFRPAVHVTLWS